MKESKKVSDHSEETRAIYHKQHERIAGDAVAMERFLGMFSPEYFGVDQDFFEGKKVLDAGCGDTAKVLISMARMGASEIHGVDLGSDFIPVAKSSLIRQGVDLDKTSVILKSGSVLALPYEDNSFDFTVCHGVLLHLNSLEEVRTAFSELARVTKPGGVLYSVYGVVGGLLEDALVPAMREYYRSNSQFKDFIDGICPENFEEAVSLATQVLRDNQQSPVDYSVFLSQLDVDFCVMLQNLIQAPVRLRVDEEMVRSMYSQHGFEAPKRLRRFVERKNIRKFLAPFHYEYNHSFSQLFWGSGNLEFMAYKI